MKAICVHILYDKNWHTMRVHWFYCEVICTLMRLYLWQQRKFDSCYGLTRLTLNLCTGWNEICEWTQKISFHARKLVNQTILFTMWWGCDEICTIYVNSNATSGCLGIFPTRKILDWLDLNPRPSEWSWWIAEQ